jgi:hypothetical protein
MDIEDVEEEPSRKEFVPPTMNEMDIKLMLLKLDCAFPERLADKGKQRPAKFASKFEEAM